MQVQDPTALLDYTVDWTQWLGTDTITSSAWAIDPGLTSSLPSNTTTQATIWLSGGTVGINYNVKNTITTAGGRTQAISFQLRVQKRIIGA